MNRNSTFRGLVGLAMLAASTGFVTAADNVQDAKPVAGKHAKHHRFDAVAHTQRNLDQLEAKLNLKAEQKSAWQTYSEGALARAKERTEKMKAFHAKRGEGREELDTAAKIEKAAQHMRERADQLQKVAQDTRSFQQALTPEQQTIFDLYWKSQRHGKKMGHRPA